MQSRFFKQHKKLNIDETFSKKDLRKGDKQGELFIWDPIDEVPKSSEHYHGLVGLFDLIPVGLLDYDCNFCMTVSVYRDGTSTTV